MPLPKTLTLLFVFALGFAIAVSAQTSGSLRGVVNDPDGQPIPGATVTIKSASLIGGTRTLETNESGVFRFPSLPVGLYSVEVTLQGYQTVRAENIKVSLDATANVPLTMRQTMSEAVNVVAEAPLIDPDKSGLSTTYTKEIVQEVPTQRGMWDLMQAAPGVSVDVGDSQSDRLIAFGSGRQSNSWNIDGVDVTAPETGTAWWYVNPDAIDEIDVIGVGAPAEYGNHTGAVLNVVTKKGGNDFHGTANYFGQTSGLTGTNITLPDSPFTFHRDTYRDVTAQLGGPIVKDKVWFFGAVETLRDASSTPGTDPASAPTQKSDKYDFRVTTRLGQKHEISGFVHDEQYEYPEAITQFLPPSAAGNETGKNPAWGASLTSTLSDKFLLEVNYSGWWGDDFWFSQTNSLEDPFFDYDAVPTTYSGGVLYPFDYTTSRHQLQAKATTYAEKFLKSQHEFKFGVQYSHGTAETLATGLGPNGTYMYNYGGYLYQAVQAPFQYGGISNDLGFFLDDTATVNKHFTLNLGVRFDHDAGSIPEYDRLAVGTPSITKVGNFIKTGEKIPGIDNLINWNVVSPRIGFVWQPGDENKSAVTGSFGVYYDHNVVGNWDSPPPQSPPFQIFGQDPDTGEFNQLVYELTADQIKYNPDIKPPKTLQYATGYEQQITNDSSIGFQYVYKDTKDLIGWQILGGQWESVPFTDPFTQKQYILLSQVGPPTLQKGNNPGDFPGSEGLRYFQKYHGVVLTFNKRFADRWLLNASYTWSKSTGLIPRPLAQEQASPFYGSLEGSDPNNYINAEGRLQGDRPHMFRLQTVFFKLPWDLTFSAALDLESGRAHNRQILVGDLGQGTSVVIMEPGGSFRYSPVKGVDLSFGKKFALGDRAKLRVDAQVYNLLNSDQELSFGTLELQTPGDQFIADTWVKPRRMQFRLGVEF